LRTGRFKRVPMKGYAVKEDDFKVAFVPMVRSTTTFTHLFYH